MGAVHLRRSAASVDILRMRATRLACHPKLAEGERRMVDGRRLELPTSALRTHPAGNAKRRDVNTLRRSFFVCVWAWKPAYSLIVFIPPYSRWAEWRAELAHERVRDPELSRGNEYSKVNSWLADAQAAGFDV